MIPFIEDLKFYDISYLNIYKNINFLDILVSMNYDDYKPQTKWVWCNIYIEDTLL